MATDERFSDQLERWLRSDQPKTLEALGDARRDVYAASSGLTSR